MIIAPTNGLVFTVGRFQTDELTNGHRKLLDLVYQAKYPLCFIGSANKQRSKMNPLPPQAIEYMIKTDYPKMTVMKLDDVGFAGDSQSDKTWSQNLDSLITEYIMEHEDIESVCGISGYDGFAPHYKGEFLLIRLPRPVDPVHSVTVRENIGRGEIPVQLAERRAMIWLSQQPGVF